MSRRLRLTRILVILALAAVLVGSISLGVQTRVAYAAGPTTTTMSGTETLNLSAVQCAQLKAAFPQYASDPRLCQLTHGWTETTATTTTRSTGAIPFGSSCWTGTHSFHDWVNSGISNIWWEEDLDTTFSWSNPNTCNATPSLTRQVCYFSYQRNTTHRDVGCYSYIYYSPSGWSSRAAVYSADITEHYPFGQTLEFYQSQRRECYSYNAPDSCNWTAWQGL